MNGDDVIYNVLKWKVGVLKLTQFLQDIACLKLNKYISMINSFWEKHPQKTKKPNCGIHEFLLFKKNTCILSIIHVYIHIYFTHTIMPINNHYKLTLV